MDDENNALIVAEIARHVISGECPYGANSCDRFDTCTDCWWWYMVGPSGQVEV